MNEKLLNNKNISRQIECFRLLVELKMFSKVANAMNCSLSTVSNLISDLEYFYGKKLVDRHGKNGIFTTPDGLNFYNKTNSFQKNMKTAFGNFYESKTEVSNQVSIFMHPLFSNYYFINFFSNFLTDKCVLNNVCFNIFSGDKIQLDRDLKNNIDIAVFPLEWGDIGQYQHEYDVLNVKKYDIRFYMNKNNKCANIDDSDFTWKMLTDANIMPSNRGVMFKTASELIPDSEYMFSTNSVDLNFLYNGIVNNMWSVAIGAEFEKLFDCSNFAIKSHSKAPKIQFTPYWMILTIKHSDKERILAKITNYLQYFLTSE